MTSPSLNGYKLIRTLGTDDTPVSAAALGTNDGCNLEKYKYANLIIIPDGADTPTVALWVESPAGGFVRQLPAVSQAGSGAGVPFAVTWEVRGRIILPYVTGLTGDCEVWINAFEPSGTY